MFYFLIWPLIAYKNPPPDPKYIELQDLFEKMYLIWGWGEACVIGTHQMSKFYWETPIRRFFNGHGFDMSSTKDKSSIAGGKS